MLSRWSEHQREADRIQAENELAAQATAAAAERREAQIEAVTISVIVATYGSDGWQYLARRRALPSIDAQTSRPQSVHPVHDGTLAAARNRGAAEATGDWLLFLDADDQLDRRYLRSMKKAVVANGGTDLLLQPSTVPLEGGEPPVLIPASDIADGNFLVIGTVVARRTFLDVGGFRELDAYEDWDLWIRCFKHGAAHITVPDAVYMVGFDLGGRNLNSRASWTQVRDLNDLATWPGTGRPRR